MDFVQALDPSKLVLAGTVSQPGPSNFIVPQTYLLQAVSFLLSPFASPSYNLPIFLFGCYAQENAEALQSLQTVSNVQSASSPLLLPTLQIIN